MNDLTLHPSINSSPQASALALELAKILKLVAPVSMDGEAQLSWLATAIDSLVDIRADEVAAVSLEVRRSITRPPQIVPTICKLVSEKRARSSIGSERSPFAAKKAIYEKADAMRAEAAKRKDQRARNREMEEAFLWGRQALQAAGFAVDPFPLPLSREELDTMPSHVRNMGIEAGFLEYRDGILCECRA